MQLIYVNEDRLIEWDGAHDSGSGTYLNTATVTAALKDSTGGVVTNASTIEFTCASTVLGIYRGVIPKTASITAGNMYYLEITLTQGTYDGFRRIECKAVHHKET